MTPITLRFTLGLGDYLAAQYFHAKSSIWLYANYIGGRYFLPVIGVLLIVQGAFLWKFSSPPVVPAALAGFGLFLAFYPLYLRHRLKRCYTRTRTGNDECTVTFEEESFRTEGQNSNSDVKWAAVKKFRENDKLFLLYLAPAKFLVLPKNQFQPGQVDEFRALLAKKLQ